MQHLDLYPPTTVREPGVEPPKRKKPHGERQRLGALKGRSISQATVRNMRRVYSMGLPFKEIALMFGASLNYTYNVLANGLRDDEREVL